jgi:hypothetical protein
LDFASASQISLAEGGQLEDVDFHLQKIHAFTIRGRILSPAEDFAASQIRVVLAHAEGNVTSSLDRASATFDSRTGRFEFHGVSPGNYLLVASQLYKGRTFAGRTPIELAAGSPAPENLTVPVTPAFDITGIVALEGGTPAKLANINVRLQPVEGLSPGPEPSSKVAANGSIRLSGVTPGAWQLTLDSLPEGIWIKAASFAEFDLLRGELNLSGGPRGQLHVELADNAAQISGTVTEDRQPRPATVVLIPVEPDLRRSQTYATSSTREQGSFAFKSVRPGSYKLFAFEDLEPYSWLDPDLLKPVESTGQSVSVNQGERITVQVSPISADALLPH